MKEIFSEIPYLTLRRKHMKSSFILLSCLLSIALLQAEPLTTKCRGCGGKKRHKHHTHVVQDAFLSSCGCGGGGGNGSNDIPPPNEEK